MNKYASQYVNLVSAMVKNASWSGGIGPMRDTEEPDIYKNLNSEEGFGTLSKERERLQKIVDAGPKKVFGFMPANRRHKNDIRRLDRISSLHDSHKLNPANMQPPPGQFNSSPPAGGAAPTPQLNGQQGQQQQPSVMFGQQPQGGGQVPQGGGAANGGPQGGQQGAGDWRGVGARGAYGPPGSPVPNPLEKFKENLSVPLRAFGFGTKTDGGLPGMQDSGISTIKQF